MFQTVLLYFGLDDPESKYWQKGKRYFSTPKIHTGPGAHPASYPVGTGGFPEVKRPGREFDHSCPFSAVVKNEWSYASCLHGVTGTAFCLFPLNCYLFCSAELQLSTGQQLKLLLQIFKGYCKVYT
jgi:hypothetical protein